MAVSPFKGPPLYFDPLQKILDLLLVLLLPLLLLAGGALLYIYSMLGGGYHFNCIE